MRMNACTTMCPFRRCRTSRQPVRRGYPADRRTEQSVVTGACSARPSRRPGGFGKDDGARRPTLWPPLPKRTCIQGRVISTHQPSPTGGETLADAGEFAVIRTVTHGRGQPPSTLLGPGDDAAVVAAPDARVVVSTDLAVDGVHFRTDWATGEQIGKRAALAAMADIAAMGAVPTALVVGLSAPGSTL